MKGKWAEDVAAGYLKSNGYKILDRNFRTRFGEIDIIAFKQGTLIFVEVKYGEGGRFRVDRRKMNRIKMAANFYLKDFEYDEVRLDVIEVTEEEVLHIKGVGD